MQKVKTVAKLKHLRTSPRKVRLVADLIRGKKVVQAIALLENSKKHAATPILKLLFSAVANGKNNEKMVEETMVVSEIRVDEGPILHRWMPRAMGRATPLHKRSSHISLMIEGDALEDKKKKKEKKKKELETEKKNK